MFPRRLFSPSPSPPSSPPPPLPGPSPTLFPPATPLAILHPPPRVPHLSSLEPPLSFLPLFPLLLLFPLPLLFRLLLCFCSFLWQSHSPSDPSNHLPSIFSLQSLPYLPTRAPHLSFQTCCCITCPSPLYRRRGRGARWIQAQSELPTGRREAAGSSRSRP